VRLGAGSGFAGDRIDPAVDLAERGDLDYLVFECLGERTVAATVPSREQAAVVGQEVEALYTNGPAGGGGDGDGKTLSYHLLALELPA
jgi:hypothetical protein